MAKGLGKLGETETGEIDAGIFAETRLGFAPDAKQMEVLRSTAKRGILNCSRQWGKSTVAAAKAVHRAFTRPGCLVLVASPTERQSAEFLRKASAMVRKLDIQARGDGDNAISVLFPNGSRIVGLPGTEATVRGFSAASLILIDEASRVADDMYTCLRPILAVGDGDLWLMSTPNGPRGFFYEVWSGGGEAGSGGGDEWMRVSVPATECERIPAKFLEKERGAMTKAMFAQEYMCEFTGDGTELFSRELLEAAIDLSIPELKIDGWR
jgi:phage FluMu gp28-like protein